MWEWIIHHLKRKSTNIKTKLATFWQDIVLLFIFFSVLMFAAQRSQILRQEWKIWWKVQVGKAAPTTGCPCEEKMINALSLSQHLLPSLPLDERAGRQAKALEEVLFGQANFSLEHISSYQAVSNLWQQIMIILLLPGSHKCDLHLLWLVTLLLLSSGVLFGWGGGCSHLHRTSRHSRKNTNNDGRHVINIWY